MIEVDVAKFQQFLKDGSEAKLAKGEKAQESDDEFATDEEDGLGETVATKGFAFYTNFQSSLHTPFSQTSQRRVAMILPILRMGLFPHDLRQ